LAWKCHVATAGPGYVRVQGFGGGKQYKLFTYFEPV
jgi:hypothetical protein